MEEIIQIMDKKDAETIIVHAYFKRNTPMRSNPVSVQNIWNQRINKLTVTLGFQESCC